MNYKTNGIITKINEYSDNDLILNIYTYDFGLINVFAKGAKNTKSKKLSATNLFVLAEFELYRSKKWYKLNSIDVIESFYFIREDIAKLSYASYFGELINAVSAVDKPDRQSFKLLTEALTALKVYDQKLIKVAFEYKLLKNIGLEPQLFYCLNCDKAIAYDRNIFSVSDGGIYCPECHQVPNNGLNISGKLLKILRFFSSENFKTIVTIEINDLFIKKLDIIMMKYISYHIEKSNFKSLKFLNILGGN
jgi:DNA repair protein RecO (recombination protein O)